VICSPFPYQQGLYWLPHERHLLAIISYPALQGRHRLGHSTGETFLRAWLCSRRAGRESVGVCATYDLRTHELGDVDNDVSFAISIIERGEQGAKDDGGGLDPRSMRRFLPANNVKGGNRAVEVRSLPGEPGAWHFESKALSRRAALGPFHTPGRLTARLTGHLFAEPNRPIA
jgi:hypothetical protein